MFADLGGRLLDLCVLLGLVAATSGLWVVLLAGTGGRTGSLLRPFLPLVVAATGAAAALATLTATYATSARVGHVAVEPAMAAAGVSLIAALVLAGRVPLPLRAAVAGAVVLVLVGELFSTRLGATPLPWIPMASLAAFAAFSRPATARLLERPLVHRAAGLAALTCIGLPLLLGQQVHGAYVQVELPWMGSIQTQEPGRVLLVVWLAGSLARRRAGLLSRDRRYAGVPLPDLGFLLTSILPAVVAVGLGALSNDYGPALVVAVVTAVMLAVAGAKRRYFVTAALAGGLGCAAVVATVDKVARRLDAVRDPLGTGGDLGQVGAGLVAISHGDLTGLGLGRGLPATIPAVRTDLLTAALAQELGAVGLLCVVLLVLLVGVGCLEVARTAPKDTGTLLAAGLGALLLVQSLLVVGGVLGLAPLTGMPVPLLSTSGSSLISASMALGLVVSVARSGAHEVVMPKALRRRLAVTEVTVVALSVILAAAGVRLAVAPAAAVERAAHGDALSTRLAMLDRGEIRTHDGKVLARTERADRALPLRLDNAVRRYPGGLAYAALVGHTSVLGSGTGLERSLAGELTCRDARRLTGNGCPSVELTLDSRVQDVAADAMHGRTGAVIAVDLRSGNVLAYGSWPAVDPAPYGDPARTPPTGGIRADTVVGATTFPGSVAKLAVGIVAEEQGVGLLDDPLAAYYVAGGRITSFTGAPCGGTGIADAVAESCNTEFAHIGDELGADGLAESTAGLLNQQRTLAGLPVQPSRLVDRGAGEFLAAAGAIGMGDAQATPFAISQLTALVARDGSPLTYHLVDGAREESSDPGVDSDDVAAVRDGMRAAVTSGTASDVDGLADLDAAAKTGTADYEAGQNNAWFTTYAPYDEPRFAVTIVVRPGKERASGLVGSRDAGPIAAQVLAACFRWAA